MLEKTARKPSSDPVQERLRANKANWNKEVSSFINDLIHLKKMMNGWPSKFFKERSRIGDPIPADPATIIGSLASDFQELAQRGEAIVTEQLNYAKGRKKRQPKQMNLPLQQPQQPQPAQPEAPAPTVDLTKQLSLPAVASATGDLIKFASEMEDRYGLISEGSNPITRFITKLLTPTIGFGEAARIRRLRMTLLNACAKAVKDLKKLQNEIVKSNKGSIGQSHQIMTEVWNNWSTVARGFAAAKELRPDTPPDSGGDIEMLTREEKEELAQQQALEPNQTPPGADPWAREEMPLYQWERVKKMVADFTTYRPMLGWASDGGGYLIELEHAIDKIRATPKAQRLGVIGDTEQFYEKAINNINQDLGTTGRSFKEIIEQLKKKGRPLPQVRPVTPSPIAPVPGPLEEEDQGPEELTTEAQLGRWLRKTRHQLVPTGTSGSRLEIYRLIGQARKDINHIMDWLESGWYPEQLGQGIPDINRQITTLRALVRNLHYTAGPKAKVK